MGRKYLTLLMAPLRGLLCGWAFWHSSLQHERDRRTDTQFSFENV